MDNFIQPLSDEFKNVYFVRGKGNGGYPYSNSLLIEDYLIDTGISSKHLRKLKKEFSINNILLSHWHEDHILGNRLLKNANFLCHIEDKPVIENINKMEIYYGLLNTPAEGILEPFIQGFNIKNTKISKTIEDNEIIEIGKNFRLKVLHTPGHSAGHCCFYEENLKIIFLADIDLTRFGPFYGSMDSNLINFEESIEKLKKLDIEIAISSHKGVFKGTKLIKEELNKYLLIIYKRDERILSHLSEMTPLNSLDLMNKNIIYKKYSEFGKVFEIISERIMIEKHFDKFLKNNIIEKKNNGYILS